MNPTTEQLDAAKKSTTGESLKVEAFAGAGKTSTLNIIARENINRNGLYLAFNKSIADEAKGKFPSTVDCRTGHSMAFRALGKDYSKRLGGRLTGKIIAEHLNLGNNQVGDLKGNTLGSLINQTISRFCYSMSDMISERHVPQLEKLGRGELSEVADLAFQFMSDLQSHNCSLPVTHDMYLKWWILTKPKISVDYIMFDEAQDANGAMLQLCKAQDCQMIYVGDRYQQIYSWRGAMNAMSTIETVNVAHLTQSFRFGNEIAKLANSVLNGYLEAGVDIKGFDQIESEICEVENPDAILYRTNGALLAHAIRLLKQDKKPHIVGGVNQLISLVRAAENLNRGYGTNHPELSIFNDWADLYEFAQTDEGSDIKQLLSVIETYGFDALLGFLSRISMIPEKFADCILSTAHKSKGREWSSVKLGNDFAYEEDNEDEPENSKPVNDEEYNLLYVAVTRAQNKLDISDCPAVKKVFSNQGS